jgi:hypothetical protein
VILTEMKDEILYSIKRAKLDEITDAEIASVIADIHLELINRIYLDKHYGGDTPPRLEVRTV